MTITAPDAGNRTIRQAVEADLLEVLRIEKRSFPQPWPYRAFLGFVGEPGFLVAEVDGMVAGYVVADTVPTFGRDRGHIKDLAVHPQCRGRGLATELLRRALAVLRNDGVQTVKLEVRATNDEAISLYESVGFACDRTVPRYYENGEDAHVMVRELG